MRVFADNTLVDGMRDCIKKPIIVGAAQVQDWFRVDTPEGNYKQGNPGDYLMRGIYGELYVCDKLVFEANYQWFSEKECHGEAENMKRKYRSGRVSYPFISMRTGEMILLPLFNTSEEAICARNAAHSLAYKHGWKFKTELRVTDAGFFELIVCRVG